MATVFDVSDWFLSKESMTPKKLQKLCYYYKAWGLTLYDEDLLSYIKFEAWVHGPVNSELYRYYKGYLWKNILQCPDNSREFNSRELELWESVWYTYGELTANAIEVLTHMEEPWRKARGSLEEFASCTHEITNENMKSYYCRIYEEHQGE